MSNWTQRRRRLCSVAFFFSLRAVLLTAQVMLLAPLLRSKRRGAYRTHAVLTCFALLVLLLLCGATPFLLRIIASTYERVSVQFDAIFLLIAMTSQVSDISIVLISMLSQIRQRRHLCDFLNQLQDTVQRVRAIHGRNFITARVLLLLWLQLGLTLYDMLTQLVFLAKLSFKIAPWQIVVNLLSLYLQQCRATLQLVIMCCVLLLIACYTQLAECLERFSEDSSAELTNYEDLVWLQKVLYKLTLQLKDVFQFPLFLLVVGEFISVLANLYAQLHYYVTTKAWWFAFVFYCAKISVELYLLIHVVYFCCVLHEKVTNLFLDRDMDFEEPHCRFELTHTDVLWPQPIRFYILGMFELNNEFWLFLVSYSVNFIVIILQFGFFT
ncbi:putative gustatory receptor 89a [Bactrocera neohumeralis]|uniref:putative gustatory receptor 89a n=1 Tax=Bactrocera neohumeralis TaxID=98809 RepID=UPI0021654DCD|nr:putative gustatory receptor 89a [Bactrocera neohumeralis]